MSIVAVVMAIMAAGFNAASSVLQRQAAISLGDEVRLFTKNFHLALTKHRRWLAGLAAQILAAVCQAVALRFGPLSLVEPLLITNLLFMVLIMHFMNKGFRPRAREWAGAAFIFIGLGLFFLVAAPVETHAPFVLRNWLLIYGFGFGVVALGAVFMALSRAVRPRTASGSLATALNYGLSAGFAKLALAHLVSHGFVGMLASWPFYAFCLSGILSLLLMQSTHAAGPLAVSSPITETVQPIVSIGIGVALFGDLLKHSLVALAAEIICGLIAVLGVVMLSRSRRLLVSLNEPI